MIGPLMIGDSSAAAAGGRGAGTAGGAGGAALATFSATGGAGGGAGTAEGAGGAKAAPLLNFHATGGAGGAWLGIFPAVGAAAGVEPVTVPATDATPGGFAGGTACAGDGDCSSDMPHMPQKRLVVGFSLPQRGQRTEPPDLLHP
jgi:hypothetical protein